VTSLLQQNGGAKVEIAKSLLFSGKIEKVSAFINTVHLYLSMKIMGELKTMKMAYVLSYVQGKVAEA